MIQLLRLTYDFIQRYALIFWACMVANLLGAVIGGIFWYGGMILRSPAWALPFIPDCPLAALLATIAFVAHRYGRRWPWFTALTAFACLKYGAWTIAFWLKHWSGGGLIEPISAGLFITHIGLMAEGALLVPQIGRLSLGARLATIGWFALSIFVDYGLGFHPPLTPQVPVEFVFWLATGLTIALGVGLLLLPSREPLAAPQPAAA